MYLENKILCHPLWNDIFIQNLESETGAEGVNIYEEIRTRNIIRNEKTV